MFTVKYRTYVRAAVQNAEAGSPTFYNPCEQIHGPFDMVSQEYVDGFMVIYAHRGTEPGFTYGPIEADAAGQPRPTLWIMNETGATVAKYDL